ncbi:hypothetical protein ACJIZ3_019334 [Penstemon smallii]|uniref:Uncharacterized protein n=1 Tax=Penstemon smallii TaxID=265156 RepID=A0ABD3T103_9LAMI
MKSLLQFVILVSLILLGGGEKGVMARNCDGQIAIDIDVCNTMICTRACQEKYGATAQGYCSGSDACTCNYRC